MTINEPVLIIIRSILLEVLLNKLMLLVVQQVIIVEIVIICPCEQPTVLIVDCFLITLAEEEYRNRITGMSMDMVAKLHGTMTVIVVVGLSMVMSYWE